MLTFLTMKELAEIQKKLSIRKFDSRLIEIEKEKRVELSTWRKVEKKILVQKAKLNWLRLGDGNNSYLHEKHKDSTIRKLCRGDGTEERTFQGIELEVLNFYKGLVGQKANVLKGLDIFVLRNGKQVTMD